MSTRMFGRLHQRNTAEHCMSSSVHVMHATIMISITILLPFRSGREAEMSTVLKYLNRDIG